MKYRAFILTAICLVWFTGCAAYQRIISGQPNANDLAALAHITCATSINRDHRVGMSLFLNNINTLVEQGDYTEARFQTFMAITTPAKQFREAVWLILQDELMLEPKPGEPIWVGVTNEQFEGMVRGCKSGVDS